MRDHTGKLRVKEVTLRIIRREGMAPDKRLKKEEIDGLVKIIHQLSRFWKPEGVECVLLPPPTEELAITIANLKSPIRIDVSSNRAFIVDLSTYRTYKVAQQQRTALTDLLAGASREDKAPR